MARFTRRKRRRSYSRSAGRLARRAGSRARNLAREHREDVEEMAVGGAIGGLEGFIEANRENQGKDPEFVFGKKKNGSPKHKVSVGNAALVAGAVGALASGSKKISRLAAAAGTAGAALTGRRAAYDWEAGRGS